MCVCVCVCACVCVFVCVREIRGGGGEYFIHICIVREELSHYPLCGTAWWTGQKRNSGHEVGHLSVLFDRIMLAGIAFYKRHVGSGENGGN